MYSNRLGSRMNLFYQVRNKTQNVYTVVSIVEFLIDNIIVEFGGHIV